MPKWLLLSLGSILFLGCSNKVGDIVSQGDTFKNDAIFLYKRTKEDEAVKSLKKALNIYKSIDSIDKEIETLLLLFKITKKNKYLHEAELFLGHTSKKVEDSILFAKALYSMDKSIFLKLISSDEPKIKTLSLIYLYKITNNKLFLEKISYDKNDLIYSFYLVTLYSENNNIELLNEALIIDKKFESKRFIYRDLKLLSEYYKAKDDILFKLYKVRADAIYQ